LTYATTLDGVISRVRRQWQATLRPSVFTLSGNYTANDTTLSLDGDLSNIGEGSIVEVGISLYYVNAVGSSALTVFPNWEGSVSANATAGGFAEVDPRIPRSTLADMAEAEINSWGSQLWRVDSVEVPVTTAGRAYDLGATNEVIQLLETRLQPVGTSRTWTGDSWPKASAKLLRDIPTADFASGVGIQLENLPTVATNLHVVYATPFDLSPFAVTTDLVADCGLNAGQLDVLDAGLRHRLLGSGLVTRTDWQGAGMSRDSEEVNPTDILRATDMARAMRDRRLADEALELRRQWSMGG
jgi:hypothetical protein